MVAMAEIKGTMPQADPHRSTDHEGKPSRKAHGDELAAEGAE
jgi:hypothetical protein